MKKIFSKIWCLGLLAGLVTSCELDEYNPGGATESKLFETREGFEGLINSCYIDLTNVLYGKLDFPPLMEAGTDLWVTPGKGNQPGYFLYDDQLNTELSTLNAIWNSFYTMVNWANTAIYYSKPVADKYSSEEELNAKLAEAYFLRAFANFHIVELWGNAVLREKSTTETGAEMTASRSSEEDFYETIISDLKFALKWLPVQQTEYARVSKKAALGFLSKVYLQRTRLGDKEVYAKLALETAEELINNQSKYNCALYQRDNESTGFYKAVSGINNKKSTEALFVACINAGSGLNPSGWNPGRTGKYFMLSTNHAQAVNFGVVDKSIRYMRGNELYFKPSMYLLTKVFEPVKDPADSRFEESFHTAILAGNEKNITQAMIDVYGKDQSLLGHVIKGKQSKIPSCDGVFNQKMEDPSADTAILVVNYKIASADKKQAPYIVNDPWDLYTDNGQQINDANRQDFYPALSKFSPVEWACQNNVNMLDFHIMRLSEVYLIAAEAALLQNNDQGKAAHYVNVIRERATRKGHNVSEMTAASSEMTVRYIMDERARELCGEHMRWFDLKRAGLLSKEYFQETNPESAANFNAAKHLKRPIPRSFLDQISNASEFGTNGY